MPSIVHGTRTVVTKGYYLSEEGTGYSFEPCTRPGDFSSVPGGEINGYDEPCRFLVADGYYLDKGWFGDLYLYPFAAMDNPCILGISATEAIAQGLVTVLHNEGDK